MNKKVILWGLLLLWAIIALSGCAHFTSDEYWDPNQWQYAGFSGPGYGRPTYQQPAPVYYPQQRSNEPVPTVQPVTPGWVVCSRNGSMVVCR